MNAHKTIVIALQRLVGTARCAVRAAFSGATHQMCPCPVRESFRPLLRGRGRRSATAPTRTSRRDVPTIHFIDVFGNEIQDDMEAVLA